MEARLLRPDDGAAVLALLSSVHLKLPEGVEFGIGLFEARKLWGCCFLKGHMIQGLAVDASRQGEGLAATLASEMVKRAAERGVRTLSVITKSEMAGQIAGIGFRLVISAPPYAALLEFGRGGIEPYLASLRAQAEGKPSPRAAVVLNANPFTLGHLHLLERACRENAWVFALVVEEDLSEFPFRERIELVRQGTAQLHNLTVIAGGGYVVSSLTFPSYFTKDEDLAPAQGALDAALFAQKLAPALGVTRRYVGTEPLSPVTCAYNRQLQLRLPRAGVALTEVPRLEIGGQPVSASRVRAALQEGDLASIRGIVPETTYRHLERMTHGQ